MSLTYAQLKQAIQDYTQNTETTFVNNLPLFIRFSEERILKTVQLSLFRKNATTTATTSNQYLACPSDFLAPLSLFLQNATVLFTIVLLLIVDGRLFISCSLPCKSRPPSPRPPFPNLLECGIP